MKKHNLFTLLFLLSLVSSVYGQTHRETRDLRAFNAVRISHSITAELIQGNENRIEITATGIDLDNIETGIYNETLEVKLTRGNFRNHSIKVVVTYKDIQGIEATTSAKVVAKTPIEAAEAYVFAATNAYVEANITSEILHIEAATNAKVYLEGNADELNIKAFTNAEVDGENLQAGVVWIQANTASTSYVDAAESIEGTLATAAKMFYGGNPSHVNVKTTTGANINKR